MLRDRYEKMSWRNKTETKKDVNEMERDRRDKRQTKQREREGNETKVKTGKGM